MSNARLGITGSIDGGGLPYSTNWDGGLNSIKYNGKESIDSESPSSFLSDYTFYGALGEPKKIEFAASDVKVLDNIAAVSYPEYTDLNKIVHTISPKSEDYIPLLGLYGTQGPIFDPGVVILPIFDFSFIEEFNLSSEILSERINSSQNKTPHLDLDGLYIVVTYQGDASDAVGHWESVEGLAGQKQILRWCPPGFYLEGQNSIDPDGYIPPGYFSIRQVEKLKYSACDYKCDIERMYVVVANIGFKAKSFYSTEALSCKPYGSNDVFVPTPPAQIPDIIDAQGNITFTSFVYEQEPPEEQQFGAFQSFDWENFQEKQQTYGDAICYDCQANCSLQILSPGQTCAQYGYFTSQEECEYSKANHDCKKAKCLCCNGGVEGGVEPGETDDSSCVGYFDAIFLAGKYTCATVCTSNDYPAPYRQDNCKCTKSPIFGFDTGNPHPQVGKSCSMTRCPCCIYEGCNYYPLECLGAGKCWDSSESSYDGKPCIPCTNPGPLAPPCEAGILCYNCIEDVGCVAVYAAEGCETCSQCGLYETQQNCEAVCNVETIVCYQCVDGECFATTLNGTPCQSCEDCGFSETRQACEALCFEPPPPPPNIKCNCCSPFESPNVVGTCQEQEFPDVGLPCQVFCNVCPAEQLGLFCLSDERCQCCMSDWDSLESNCISLPLSQAFSKCSDFCKSCAELGASCDPGNPEDVICKCCVDGNCLEVKYPPGTKCSEVCSSCPDISSICETGFKTCNCCVDYGFGKNCSSVVVPNSVDCQSFCAQCDPANTETACSDNRVSCRCCVGDGINARCTDVLYPAGTDCSTVCSECLSSDTVCSGGDGGGGDGGGGGDQDCVRGSVLSFVVKASEITLVRYKPIIECGKVDLYNRCQGLISSSSNGVYVSANHGLSYKDEVKLFDSLKNKNLNGTFYVGEIVSENSFRLYKEESLTTPIVQQVSENIKWQKTSNKAGFDNLHINGVVDFGSGLTLSSSGQSWETDGLINYQITITKGYAQGQTRTIVANSFNELTVSSDWDTIPVAGDSFVVTCGTSSSWNYHSTVFSPRGQNGYGEVLKVPDTQSDNLDSILLSKYQSRLTSSVKQRKLPADFDKKSNFDEIFIEDNFSHLGSVKFSIPDNFYIWNHIRDLRNPDAVKLASILDMYCMFPVFGRATLPENGILAGRLVDSYNNSLAFVDFKNNGKIANQGFSDYGVGDIWTSSFNIVNGFKFGCSIDIDKDASGKYYLIVGDRGSEHIIPTNSGQVFLKEEKSYPEYRHINPWHGNAPLFTSNSYYQLPQYVHGSAFLFEINVNSSGNMSDFVNGVPQSISLSDWYCAYKSDDSISNPIPLTTAYDSDYDSDVFNLEFFEKKDLLPITLYYRGDVVDFNKDEMLYRLKDTIKNSLFECSGNYVLYNNQNIFEQIFDFEQIETDANSAHWYKGMIFGLADINSGKKWQSAVLSPSENQQSCYFADLTVPSIESSSGDFYSSNEKKNQKLNAGFYRKNFNLYPYIDSFGKSVAIKVFGSDKHIFISTKVKPYIYRPKAGDTSVPGQIGSDCLDSLLSVCNCGYIFAFKNGDKIQQIFDEASYGVSTPSKSWVGQYSKAQSFCSTIIAKNSELYWGESKPVEISEESVEWYNEVSKIFVYSKDGDFYSLSQEIANQNDRFIEYTASSNCPDLKGFYLKNHLDQLYAENDPSVFYYPSDRFGAYFRVDDDTLVTNAFDDRNELGDIHRQVRWPYSTFSDGGTESNWVEFNRTQDYLHVYRRINGQWQFSQKIAPAFNYSDPKFRYFVDDYIQKVPNSIRSIANISYSNTNYNSLTWDIDLTGRFDTIDNRIILKDPISVSIFSKDLSLNQENELSPASDFSLRTLFLEPYFTYTEDFNADYLIEEGLCNVEFDRVSNLYSYDLELSDKAQVVYRSSQEPDGDRYVKATTPIYFVNIPKQNLDFYSIQQISLIVDEIPSNILNPTLKLVLYKKDPRQTVYPYYSDEMSTCLPPFSSSRIKSRRTPDSFIPYRGGALDLPLYDLDSFRSKTDFASCNNQVVQGICLAKTISPTESIVAVDNRKSNEYVINLEDLNFSLNDFIVQDNLISSGTRTFGSVLSEQLTFNDLSSIGYDSSIDVKDSLIIGFVFESDEYGFDNGAPKDYQSQINIAKITARIKYSNSNYGNYSSSLRNYSCISTDVLEVPTDAKLLNFYENRNHYIDEYQRGYKQINPEVPVLKYSQSAIGISSTDSAASSVGEVEYSKSYSIVSTDDVVINSTSSFDIHKLEYLSLFIGGAFFVKSFETASLNIFGPLNNNNNCTLIVDGSGIINQSGNLVVSGPNESIDVTGLYTKSSFASVGSCVLFVRSQSNNAGNASLVAKSMSPKTMPLFVEAPKGFREIAPLFVSSFYDEQSTTLFINRPIADFSGDTTLLLKADISSVETSLYLSGPVPKNQSQDLFLKTYDLDNGSTSLFMMVPNFYENGMRLRLPNPSGLSSAGLPMFISTTTLNSSPLYLKSLDPTNLFDVSSLSIYGSVLPVNPTNDSTDLVLLGKSDLYRYIESGASLFIDGPSKVGVEDFTSLYIGNIWYKDSKATTLHTGGSYSNSNVMIGKTPVATTSLFVSSKYHEDNDTTMFIFAQSGGSSVDLFLKSNQMIYGSTLFVDANYGMNGSLNLAIKDTVGRSIEDAFIYINGFRR
jgi:hypothetical protein